MMSRRGEMRAAGCAVVAAVIVFFAGPPVVFGGEPEPAGDIRVESADAGERVKEPTAPSDEELRENGAAPRAPGGIDEIEKKLEEPSERQERGVEDRLLQLRLDDERLLSALR
jgi:hypothetical protein